MIIAVELRGESEMVDGNKAMVFVDTPNIIISARHFDIIRLDFLKLIDAIMGKANKVGANAYVVDRPEHHSFYLTLERLGIRVERVSLGKSVDGRLIFDMLIGAIRDDYDIAILCSGDRDYVPVVEAIKRMGKEVWVASFTHSVNPGLKNAADEFINLDKHVTKICLSKVLNEKARY